MFAIAKSLLRRFYEIVAFIFCKTNYYARYAQFSVFYLFRIYMGEKQDRLPFHITNDLLNRHDN